VRIDRLDHLVLTVRDVEATCAFYERVMRMQSVTFAGGRRALTFGNQKLNLHPADVLIAPHAARPTPGSADLCFITTTPIDDVVVHLRSLGVVIEDGPVRRTGATGPIVSIYFRDPDDNLIEVAEYVHHTASQAGALGVQRDSNGADRNGAGRDGAGHDGAGHDGAGQEVAGCRRARNA
jgi:catechol 2,3-dioxygenase-like lactoylglutathione lyase family enzyme